MYGNSTILDESGIQALNNDALNFVDPDAQGKKAATSSSNLPDAMRSYAAVANPDNLADDTVSLGYNALLNSNDPEAVKQRAAGAEANDPLAQGLNAAGSNSDNAKGQLLGSGSLNLNDPICAGADSALGHKDGVDGIQVGDLTPVNRNNTSTFNQDPADAPEKDKSEMGQITPSSKKEVAAFLRISTDLVDQND